MNWQPCRLGGTFIVLFCALAFATPPAKAGERRFALVIGANVGSADDKPLLYALRDARQVSEALVDLGGFSPENVVVLADPTPELVRHALGGLNVRIRRDAEASASLLFVYYSGHADGNAIHLGGRDLPWEELRNLTAGSPATSRVLVLDACRAGVASRVKGAKAIPAFADSVALGGLPVGFAVLTSAAAGESAQESDELKGSFFSHHFVAALRGLGDSNGDGNISLDEAYSYASERTLAQSVRTFAGIQHPTYLIDLKGRTELVLTSGAFAKAAGWAALALDQPGVYLIRGESPSGGTWLTEAAVGKKRRVLRLPAGSYLVQHRMPNRLFETQISMQRGQTVARSGLKMEDISYAHLVRKGGSELKSAFSLSAAGGVAVPPLPDFDLGAHSQLMFSWELTHVTWEASLTLQRFSLSSGRLPSTLYVVAPGVGGRRVWDFNDTSLGLGLRVGAALNRQTYDPTDPLVQSAARRNQTIPFAEATAVVERHLSRRLFMLATTGLKISAIDIATMSGQVNERTTPVQVSVALGGGYRW